MAVGPLSISESTTENFGDTITITCSTEFVPYVYPPPTVNVNFEWFFGPDNSTLPADIDVIKSRITKNSSTYSTTLRFSPLQSTHEGMYTCHFYVNRGNIHLTASTLVLSQSPTTSSMASSNIAVVTAATMLIVIFIVIIVPVIVVAMIIYR